MLEYMMQFKFTHEFWVYVIPVVLMAIDIFTGYYNAWKKGDVSSKKMRDGIGKKIAELCYIAIGTIFGFAFDLKFITYFISIYISYMELISINENCKKLGVNLSEEAKNELIKKKKEEK